MNVLRSASKLSQRARRLTQRRTGERWRKLLLEPLEERHLLASLPSAALLATSEAFTGDADVAIGEVLRYRLQVNLPEGTTENLQLVNLLPAGLQFLDDDTAKVVLVADTPTNLSSSALFGDGLAMAGNEANLADITPTFTVPRTAIGPATFSSGTDPIFSLGTITNTENDANEEFVVLEFNALVNNNGEARHGDVKSHRFEVQVGTPSLTVATSDAVDVTICEPRIAPTKQLLIPSPRDAGDLATYRVTYVNTGSVTAFDTTLVDVLPSDLTLDPASLTLAAHDGAAGLSNISSGNTVQVTAAMIPPGGSVTVTYAARVRDTISPGRTVQNTALVTWTSLPGDHGTLANPTGSATPGAPGEEAGERTGSDSGANDYWISDSASFTAAWPMVAKSIVATSESSTSGDKVAIGEIIRFRLLVRLPEGTTEDLRLNDLLPDGLQFLNDGTAKVAFVADHVTRIASTTLAGPGLVVAGNDINIGSVTPTFVLPESAILGGPFASGSDPIFALGTISNLDNDLSTEFIVLEANALVANHATTYNESSLSNRFLVQTGTLTLATSEPVPMTVREPVLSIAQTLDGDTPRQAGDLVTYHVTYQNYGGTTGFDVRLTDTLPSHVRLDPSSIQVALNGGAVGVANASAGNTVDLTLAAIPVGGSASVVFTGVVLETITPGETVNNTAQLSYSSLPGTHGTTSNATGSTTPGDPGDVDGERTGSGTGRNNYASARSVTFTTPLVTAVQSITATSEASTSGPDVALGEIVRYRLQIALPQGTHPFLQFRSLLPPGLQFLNDQTAKVAFVASTGSGIASIAPPLELAAANLLVTGNETNVSSVVPLFTLPPEAITDPDGTQDFASGTDVIFSLGTVVNTNLDVSTEFVILEFNALINNNVDTDDGDIKSGHFLVEIQPSPTTVGTSNVISLTIREPRIELDKQLLPPVPQAVGDTVRFEATYTNTGDATAFDACLLDDLPDHLTLQLDSLQVVLDGGAGGIADASGGNGVNVTVAVVPVGGSVTVAYQAIFSAPASPGETITNAAEVTYTSLPGTNGTTGNPTFSVTPGAAGSETGERNAQDGVNDYVATSQASLPLADLRITKTGSSTTPIPGTSVTYTTIVSNSGPFAAIGAAVTDLFPAMLSGVTWTAAQTGGAWGFPANGTGHIDHTVNLPPGSSVTYTATGQIAPTATGTLTSVATITPPSDVADLDLANNMASDVATLVPTADLRIAKTNHSATVVPGTTTTYSILVTNSGPSVVTGARISDLLPASLIDVSYTATQTGGAMGFTVSGEGSIDDSAVQLPVGSTVTYVVTGTVRPSATGTLTNTATVTPPDQVIDPVSGNNTATHFAPLVPTADLKISKTNHATSLVPGLPTTYTILVTNAGPSDVNGARISDPFPLCLLGESYTATQTGGATGFTPSGSGNINDPLVHLPVGSSITYVATGLVSPAATGILSNSASVTPPPGTVDPLPGNNAATDADPLTPIADLQITKTNYVTSVQPATTTTYTIVVTNAGPSGVTGATIRDALPTFLTAATFTATQTGGAAGFSPNGSGDILDLDVSLPVGSKVTYQVTGSVSPLATGTLSNTATVTPPAGMIDPALENNSATDHDPLIARADLQITKTNHVTSLVPGTSTTYTIVVTNTGPSDVSGATVSDAFSGELTDVTYTATQTGGASGFTADGSGNILDTAVTLPVGSTLTYVATGTVRPSATGTLSNTATIAPPAGVFDPTPDNNTATDSDLLTPGADLRITKTNYASSVIPGTPTTYTIVVTNVGPSDATGVLVRDSFPAALTDVTFTASQTGGAAGFTSHGSGNIQDTAVQLPVGSSITYVAVGNIQPAASGRLSNTATVTPPASMIDPALGNNSATDNDPLIPRADLQITKTNHVTSLIPGTSTSYTIVVTNAGPSDISGATVRDAFPAALTDVSYTATQTGGASGFTASGNGDILDLAVTLPAGSTITYVATGTVRPSATGTLTNTTTIAPPAGVFDPTPNNNTATDSDLLTPGADLRITKTNHASSVIPGTPTTYTIVVTNVGPSDATGVLVRDLFPAALTDVTFTAKQTGGAAGFTTHGSGNIQDDAVKLPVGSSITYVAVGNIQPAASGRLSNTATVTPPAGIIDPASGNNSATDNDPLIPRADLRISQANETTSLTPGATTTYTIVVTNAGPSDARGVLVSDSFPTDLTSLTYTATSSGGASGYTTSGSGNIHDFAVNLPVGSSITYLATGTVRLSASGTLSNTATVTPPPGAIDPVLGNNSANDHDLLLQVADLQITKSNNVTSLVPGTATTYTIVVSNTGPSDVNGATISDAFPATLTDVSYTAAQTGGASGFTANGNGNIRDTAVTLPVGSTITYVATGTIRPSAIGTLTNTATIAPPAGVADPTPENNTATDSDLLTPRADLQITNSNNATSLVPGTNTTYTIVVTNAGPSDVSSATISDAFPATLTDVNYTATQTGGASGFTTNGNGNILDTEVTLPVGSVITYVATGTVRSSATGALTNTATVTLPAGVVDPTPDNNTATDGDLLTPTADLQITKTNYSTSIIPGTIVAYAIVVSNRGPNSVSGATISDTFPAAFTGVTYTATQIGGASGFTASGSGDLYDTAVDLPVGSEVTYVVTGLLDPSATGTLVNTATVALPADVIDPDLGNNTVTDTDPLRPTADLQISKTNHTSSPVLGDTVTYTIVVTNGGPSSVRGATVTDAFPAALASVNYTSTVTGLVSGNTPAGTGDILDTVDMAPGSTITYTASATLTKNGNGLLTNVATVTLPPGVEHPHPENSEAEDSDSLQTLIVVAPDHGNASQPWVHIVRRETGELLTRFLAFDESYRGGIRVATGDLTGDGLPEIVAVQGRNAVPEIRIFDLQGNLLHAFMAFPTLYTGGVHVAVGDVDGDAKNDVVAAMSCGGSQVVVFKNETIAANLSFREVKSFYPFGSAFKGGAVVATADLGALEGDVFLGTLDAKVELIVGNGAGMSPTVRVFEYASLQSVRTFSPLTPDFKGGLSLDTARVNADAIPDIVVAAGPGGGSKVEVLDGTNPPKTTLLSLTAYTADETTSFHAPVHVAAVDDDGDEVADVLVIAQGADGTTGIIKAFRTADPTQVSAQFTGNLPEPSDFDSAYFVLDLTAARRPGGDPVPIPASAWTNPLLAEDVNIDGRVTALDALLVINDLNRSGSRVLMGSPPPNFLPDVDASGSLEPADVLRIIRYLNAEETLASGEGEGLAGEGEGFAEANPHFAAAALRERLATVEPGILAQHLKFPGITSPTDAAPQARASDRLFAELGREAAEPLAARSKPLRKGFQTAARVSRNLQLEFLADEDWFALAEDVCRTWDRDRRSTTPLPSPRARHETLRNHR